MPQSIGLNLLARLLEDGRLADFYNLKRAYFYDTETRIYDRIAEHVQTHGILPSLSLVQRHNDITTPDSADPYGVWHDEYIRRALHNSFGELLPHLQRDLTGGNPVDALNRVTQFIEQTQTIRADGARDLTNAIEIGESVLNEFQRLRTTLNGISGIPSGWPTLDATTHGFQAGDLIVFAARPGVGKSTVAMKMALEAHRAGHIPLVVSMEMSRIQLGARLMAMSDGLNMKTLRRGQLTSNVEWLMTETTERFRQMHPFYFIEGQFRQDVNELASLVHSLRPSIVFVDGAYLLKLPSANARMPLWEKIGEIAQRLKSIAATSRIPVIATFQINREGGKKDRAGQDTGVEHLQLSDAIGQLASLIVAIFDDDSGDSLDSDRQRRMKIIKGREGERGQWFIHWNWNTCAFNEVVDPSVRNYEQREPEMEDWTDERHRPEPERPEELRV